MNYLLRIMYERVAGWSRSHRVSSSHRLSIIYFRGSYLQTTPHATEDLVLSWQEKPLSYNRARRRVRRLGKAAGVEKVYPQRLRYAYATLLLNNGMSLAGLRDLMVHKNIKTILIYSRLADKTVERQYHAAVEIVTKG